MISQAQVVRDLGVLHFDSHYATLPSLSSILHLSASFAPEVFGADRFRKLNLEVFRVAGTCKVSNVAGFEFAPLQPKAMTGKLDVD